MTKFGVHVLPGTHLTAPSKQISFWSPKILPPTSGLESEQLTCYTKKSRTQRKFNTEFNLLPYFGIEFRKTSSEYTTLHSDFLTENQSVAP